MKHDQEVYDQARDEMLADMLDYIPEGLIAEVLADEWVLWSNPEKFALAVHDTLCECLSDDTVSVWSIPCRYRFAWYSELLIIKTPE